MKRQLALFTALASAAALVVVAVPAGAGAPPPAGTGAPGACPTTGQISIKPALVASGTTPTVIKLKTKQPKGGVCTGGSGDGANLASMQGAGTGGGANNNCTSILGPATTNISMTIKWKMAKGATPKKIADSTLTITTATGGISTTPPNHGQFDVALSDGVTITSGSFMGDHVTAHIVTDQDAAELGTACGAKGIKKISFGAKASKDDGQIGSGVFTIAP